MRAGLLSVMVMTWSLGAFAEDARVTFLVKQLKTTQDARVRTQSVLLLGQTGSADAVPPLCSLLKDGDSVIRSAAANALGDLHGPAAIDCLKTALGEAEPAVRAALQRALASAAAAQPMPIVKTETIQPPVTSSKIYVRVESVIDRVGDLPASVVALAEQLMHDKLVTMGVEFVPEKETRAAAIKVIKAQGMKAFLLRLQLMPGAGDRALKVEMLVMSYPEQTLQGSWNVKASGAKPEALIKAMVPRVIDDAAGDLNWKN